VKLKECFIKRLLRREIPDLQKSERSMEISETKLNEAQKALSHGLFDAATILAYTAMFHAARSILFRDGIIEKSHVCLIEYLREKYVYTRKMSEAVINSLNTLRIERHETLYGLVTETSGEEAKFSLKEATEFIETIKQLLPVKP
jgi:uncharacterized protein (UPF0332 family)